MIWIMKTDNEWLAEFLKQPPVKRISVLTKVGREELERMPKNDEYRAKKKMWFERLRRYMRDYRISKESLLEHGVNYQDCVNYFYAN